MSVTYENARPAVTADALLFTIIHGRLHLLLIRRHSDPYGGCWALPGGFCQENEEPGSTALRALAEETGVRDVWMEQLFTFGQPGRDPRGWVISVAFFALVASERLSPHAQDDERQARWWSVDELPPLAFDHSQMVAYALFRLRTKIEYSNVGFQLLPREFTLPALQRVYEAVLGNPIDKRNFRKKVLESGAVRPTGRTLLTGRSGVQPQLYEYTGQHFEFERPRRNGRVE
ncbi:MAG: NUDIX domain-containing protein [Chloroflexota bacterium]